MKNVLRMMLSGIVMCVMTTSLMGAEPKPEVNYDESKVPAFELPSLLTCADGSVVTTARQWERKRRPEVLEMFEQQMFGCTPKEKIRMRTEVVAENPAALGGIATSQQVRFTFEAGGRTLEALLLVYIPNERKGRVPVIWQYNFQGNPSTTDEPDILPTMCATSIWGSDKYARGAQKTRWNYRLALERGYAVATMCYEDICPDTPQKRDLGAEALFRGYTTATQRDDEWQAIGAWAWGSSRVCDWLCRQRWVDKRHITIAGHSRLGKAALWAGAQDERFSAVISNCSGCGGAALSKRCFGETVGAITRSFPHWFCPGYASYGEGEAAMPFDQHELLALVAPRHLYVNSAKEDQWADPKGEFLATLAAGEVWRLYGMKGLPSEMMPAVHTPLRGDIGYHIREGIHDVTDYDWTAWLDFLESVR